MAQVILPDFTQSQPVCDPGDLSFAAVGLDHPHIYGQTKHLITAGASLKWVYDPDPAKTQRFLTVFPQAKVARDLDEILTDPVVRLVTSASIPSERAALGEKVMLSGKDYLVDKSPLTTLEQLESVRRIAQQTGRKYIGCYSERLCTESGVYVEILLKEKIIGEIVQIIGLGPHKLNAESRPPWFFDKNSYGGILVDIGSHQTDQFLAYTGAKNARVVHAAVDNINNPTHPELEDFGEACLLDEKNRRGYFRVDWFTPKALPVFGDGRTMVIGTKGTIEVRKYIDIGRMETDQIYVVTDEGQATVSAKGKVGLPFFGKLILDCLNRTENAMSQEHSFQAVELCIQAQVLADSQRKELI